MASFNDIPPVLELLPAPYLVIRPGDDGYAVIAFNSAYRQKIDPSATCGALAANLPFKEPLFEKRLTKLLIRCTETREDCTMQYITPQACCDITITPVYAKQDIPEYLLLHFALKDNEPAILGSDHVYYGSFDHIIEGYQLIGFDWKYIYINEAAARQGQYDRSYYPGRTIQELYPGVEQSDLFRILDMCMQTRMIQKTEQEFSFANGKKRWFDLHIYPSESGIFILSLDITERKKHEEQLRQSEHRFRTLYEYSVDMVVLFDKRLKILYESPSTQRHIGWSNEELASFSPMVLVYDDDQQALKEMYKMSLAYPERPVPVSARVMHRNGNYIWLEGTITNLLHDDSIRGFVLSVRDVTARRKAELSLIKSEKELRQAQEIARIGYLHFDLVGGRSFWSDEMFHIWELDRGSFEPSLENFLATIHPDDKIKFEEFLLKLFADFTDHEIEYRIMLPGGQVKYIFQRTELEHNEAGEVVALNGIALNITERRKTEQALKESDDKFKILFNSSPLPQWLFDSDSLHIIDVNEAAINNYGYSRSEFLSMTLRDMRPEEEVAHFLDARQKALQAKSKEHKYRSFIHRKKNGQLISVDVRSSDVIINGKAARLAIARDITAELAFERQLLESNERYDLVLEATNEAVIDWDIVNDTTIWGKGFENNFGYDLSKHDNHLWSNNIYSEDRHRVLTALNLTLDNKSKRHFDASFRYVKANGELAWIQHRGIILRNRSGQPVRAIGAMIDVTELKEKMAEIELQNEKLRSIAWIQSHVVRAPVARIIGLINLLEKTGEAVDPGINVSEILSYIVNSAYELDEIIKDIVKRTEKYTKHEFKSPDH